MILVFLFIGSFCQATTGFGFGLICIGLLTIFLSVKECLLIINTLTIVMSFLILWRYRTYIRLKSLVIWLLPAAIAGRTLAFVSLKFFGEMDWAKKALGLFLLLMVVYLILQKRRSRDQTQDLRWERPGFAMGSGLLAGFIGGAFAGGGPFLVVYFLMKYADKKYYIANLQVVFFLQSIFTFGLHGMNGDYTAHVAIYMLAGIPVAMLGSYAGAKLFDRLPTARIQQAAYTIVLMAAVNAMIFSG